ncbi:MAG: hypothetical protein CMN17_10150 [Roseovarius sp.]|nr:hypothetical protein [Roseovarius sp.]
MPPAARITDMHTCPLFSGPVPHVGGPVITGEPTVIVVGVPQARITDKCICAGPTDVIVKGSPTVIVGGKPAARLGDMTAHGGVIVTGAPNVLIGEAAPPIAPFLISPICHLLAESLAENMQAQEMAQLAGAAYGNPDTEDGVPEGYRRASPEDLEQLGLYDPISGDNLTRPPDSDFRADVFVRRGSDGLQEYVVAFKGSTTGEDWLNNFLQGPGLRGGRLDRYVREKTGHGTDYYNEAAEIGRVATASARGNRVRFTGHSLGGGLASTAAAASGASAHTFNAAGLNRGTIEEFAPDGANPANVQAYYLEGDPLNRTQDAIWDGLHPEAFGNRHRMPTINEWTEADRQAGEEAVNPDNWIPDRLERSYAAHKAQQKRLHGMDEMMHSLKSQEADILAAKASNGCP